MPRRLRPHRAEGGWRKPRGSIYVGRPSPWAAADPPGMDPRLVVDRYRNRLKYVPELAERARTELAGKDLVCWCDSDNLCHADILIEVANGGQP
jgi:Domain of unknown function (DUF4326)